MTVVKPSGSKQGERHSVLPCIYPGQARSIYWRLGQVDLCDGLAASSAQTCGLVSKYCNVACKHTSKRVCVWILTFFYTVDKYTLISHWLSTIQLSFIAHSQSFPLHSRQDCYAGGLKGSNVEKTPSSRQVKDLMQANVCSVQVKIMKTASIFRLECCLAATQGVELEKDYAIFLPWPSTIHDHPWPSIAIPHHDR